jgi:hypothetical protein
MRDIPNPRITARACGGWLAVSPEDAPIRIGVTSHSEEGAKTKFEGAYKRWLEVLEIPWRPNSKWKPKIRIRPRFRSFGT